MDKYLIVTFSDGSRWQIPALFIARDRATYYAKKEPANGAPYEEVFDGELEFALEDEYELKDWAKNNMNWSDVYPIAHKMFEKVVCNYAEEWVNADMKVVES